MVEKRGYVPSDLEEMGFDVNQYPCPPKQEKPLPHWL